MIREELVLLTPGTLPGLEKLWEPVGRKILGEVHPRRLAEWVLARVALQVACEKLGVPLNPQSEFDGYHRVKDFPQIRFSLSHTADAAGAWVRMDTLAVPGLDIEKSDRVVKEGIAEKLSHPDDEELPVMSLWTIKEAAYKCLPVVLQDKIWLSRIAVKSGTFTAGEHVGTWTLEERDGILVAQALYLEGLFPTKKVNG